MHRQGQRVEELETRVADLERHLQARVQERAAQQQSKSIEQVVTKMPAERAA